MWNSRAKHDGRLARKVLQAKPAVLGFTLPQGPILWARKKSEAPQKTLVVSRSHAPPDRKPNDARI